MAFSSSDTAFEGFRLTREKPVAVAIWAGVQLAATVIFAALGATLLSGELQAIQTYSASPTPDPAGAAAIMGALAKICAVLLVPAVLLFATTTCAVYRAVLRPQEKAFGYVRLGGDELRQFLICLVFVAMLLAAMMVLVFVLTFVSAGIGMLASAPAESMIALAVPLSQLAWIVLFVWLAVRMSLTGPMTLARGRLSLRDGWMLTRGHFWRLLGCYFIAAVLSLLVALLGLAIVMAGAMLIGGGMAGIGEVMNPDTTSLAARFTPVAIFVMAASAIFNALQNTIVYAPAAVAYAELSGEGTVDTFA